MSITCQVCGTVNPDGTQFCEGCGVELKAQAAAPAAADAGSEGTPAQPELSPPTSPAPVTSGPSPLTEASGEADSTGTLPPAPVEADAAPAPEVAPQVPAQPAGGAPGESAESAPLPEGDGAGTAQTVNPDLTSSADAPEADQGVNAPVMTDHAPADAAAPAVTAPETVSGIPRTGAAKLGVKRFGTPTGDFIPLQGEKMLVGRFDASSGPVDIDLSGLPGAEHISRHHAELYREGGQWFVRDLGSTNGVFVKRAGQSAFSPRLQEPTALSDGDELAFGNLMLGFHQEA